MGALLSLTIFITFDLVSKGGAVDGDDVVDVIDEASMAGATGWVAVVTGVPIGDFPRSSGLLLLPML